ncbi:MAG TPA: YcxB family protein [Bacteroidia bacterium]|jgi:hypothetical protein|nr:YcxB family protein [Bacteroidia bacterium]
MEKITIETKLDIKDVYKVTLYSLYTNPFVIGISVFELIMLFVKFINFIGYSFLIFPSGDFSDTTFPVWSFICVGIPVISYFLVKRASSKNLFAQRKYQFTKDSISIVSEDGSFKHEYKWSAILKVVELKKWLLIYMGRRQAYFIPKNAFTDLDVNAFREMASANMGTNYKLGPIINDKNRRKSIWAIIIGVNLLFSMVFINPKYLKPSSTISADKRDEILKIEKQLLDTMTKSISDSINKRPSGSH